MVSGQLNGGCWLRMGNVDNQKPQSIQALQGYNWTLYYFDIKQTYPHIDHDGSHTAPLGLDYTLLYTHGTCTMAG